MRLVIFILLTFVSWSCKKTLDEVKVRSLSGNKYVQQDFRLIPEMSTDTTISAFDNTKFSENGFFVGANFLDLCVDATLLDNKEKSVKVKYQIDNGISISSTGELTPINNNHNVCMKDDWDYKFNLANSSVSESHQISMSFYVIKNGQDILVKKFTWDIEVLANNIAPSITSVDANGNGKFISESTETWVNVYGSGFLPGPYIEINGNEITNANINYIGLNEIQVKVPSLTAGVKSLNIQNTTNNLNQTIADAIQVLAPFTTSNNTKYAGLLGTDTLTIDGAGFHQDLKVEVGGTACNNVAVANLNANNIGDQITCDIPIKSKGTYVIQITNSDNFSDVSKYDINLNPAPSIKSINTTEVKLAAGTSISIETGDLLTSPSLPTVSIIHADKVTTSECNNVTVTNDTITCDTPAMTAGTYSLRVTNHDGQSVDELNTITYNPFPTITSILNPTGVSASSTSGGYFMNVIGTGFRPGVTMTIGGTACLSLSYNSDTSLECQSPAIAADGSNQTVLITNPDTQFITDSVYYSDPPTIAMSTTTPDPFLHPSNQFFNVSVSTSSVTSDLDLSDLSTSTNTQNTLLSGSGSSYTYTAEPNNSNPVTINIPANSFSDAFGISNEMGASISFEYVAPSDLKVNNLTWQETSPNSITLNATAIWDDENEIGERSGSQWIQFFSDSSCGTAAGGLISIGNINEYLEQVYAPSNRSYKITTQHYDGNITAHNFESDCSSAIQFQGVISAMIKESCTGAPTDCYTSLNDWNTSFVGDSILTNKDLVSQGKKVITYIDEAWSASDPGNVHIEGWTTSGTKNLVFETRGNARHSGHTNGSFYKISPTVSGQSGLIIGDNTSPYDSSDTAYTVFDGIIIDKAWGINAKGIKNYAAYTNLKNIIIKDITETNNNGDAIYMSTNGAGVILDNSFIYNISGSAIAVDAPATPVLENIEVKVRNTTVVNACNTPSSTRAGDFGAIGTGANLGSYASTVSFDVRNTIAQCLYGTSSSVKGVPFQVNSSASFTATSKNNIGNNTGVPGANSYSSVIFLDKAFEGAQPGNHIYFESLESGFESPYLLNHPDNLAINNGADVVSQTPLDIEGNLRSMSKKRSDIGADEAGSVKHATELSFTHDKVLERRLGSEAGVTLLEMSWTKAASSNIDTQYVKVYGTTYTNKEDACSGNLIGNYNVGGNSNKSLDISSENYEWFFFEVETDFTTLSGLEDTTSACSKPQRVIPAEVIKWFQNATSCSGGVASANCVTNISNITPINLLTSNPKKRMRIEIDGEWTAEWTSNIEIDGWTTDIDYFVELVAVNQARHDGTVNTAEDFIVDPTSSGVDGVSLGTYGGGTTGNTNHTVIEGFVIEGFESTGVDTIGVWVRTSGNTIRDMIIRDGIKTGAGNVFGIFVNDAQASVEIENTIAYNIPGNFVMIKDDGADPSNTGILVKNSTAYNVCSTSTSGISGVGYYDVGSKSYPNSVIQVENSFIDCTNGPAFRTETIGNMGVVQGKDSFISDTTIPGQMGTIISSNFSNTLYDVGALEPSDTATKTNNIIFNDIGSDDFRLALSTNSETNNALGFSNTKMTTEKDIQNESRDYKKDVGADEFSLDAEFSFQDENDNFIEKIQFGELSSNTTFSSYQVYNTGTESVSDITISLVDNAGGAFTITSEDCSGGALSASSSCSYDLVYNSAIGGDGLKRGVIEVKANGIISKAIVVEATKIP